MMPRDTARAEPAEPRKPITLAELLAEEEGGTTRETPEVGGLPPLRGERVIRRTPRTLPVPDLSAQLKAWLLVGEGRSGKTTFARWLADQLGIRDLLGEAVIATIAPGNRALERYVANVMQPASGDAGETAAWVGKVLAALPRRRLHGVFDAGGGDQSIATLIHDEPGLVTDLEERSLALVAAYFLGPRLADLAFLKSYEQAGFQPRATALVLNLALADDPGAFDDIRRQPVYRAALERGAVELFLPAMPQDTALAIERKELHYSDACNGRMPDGRTVEMLKLRQRSDVARWLDAMQREFSVVESWLPWA